MTKLLNLVLIVVLVGDIAAHMLRWRAERAAARDVDPDIEPLLYDEPGGEPWQRRAQ